MSDYKATDTEFTAVANAIRTKGGTFAQLEWPTGFVSAITNIPSGGGSIVLPDGYTRTLFTGGTCPPQTSVKEYINTGIVPDENTWIRAIFNQIVNGAYDTFEFGCRIAYQNKMLSILTPHSGNDSLSMDYGSQRSSVSKNDVPLNSIVVAEMNIGGNFTVNGITQTFSGDFSSNNLPILLFTLNHNGTPFSSLPSSRSQFLRVTIGSGNTTQADLIPCIKNSNSEAGFYDIIRNSFYGNANSVGSFVAGPVYSDSIWN